MGSRRLQLCGGPDRLAGKPLEKPPNLGNTLGEKSVKNTSFLKKKSSGSLKTTKISKGLLVIQITEQNFPMKIQYELHI